MGFIYNAVGLGSLMEVQCKQRAEKWREKERFSSFRPSNLSLLFAGAG